MNVEEVALLLKRVLRRPVAYHRSFAELAGKASAGVMLSQAWYWSQRSDDENGWFYKTRDDWAEETALTRTEQETARKRLVDKGLLEEKLGGMPARMYYRVNVEKVLRLLAENLPTVKASSVGGKPANTKAENPPTVYISDLESTREYDAPAVSAVTKPPEFSAAASAGMSVNSARRRLPRSVVELPRGVPDRIPMTPELRDWLDSKGWKGDELADAVETWRLKRKAAGVKHTGEQWTADLMGFLKTYREMRAGGKR